MEEGKEKRSVGKPRKFSSVKKLVDKIDEYFDQGVKQKEVLVGRPPNQKKVNLKVPTVTGLAIFLGFESRQSFYDYGKNKKYSYTIKRARLFIENEYEEQLQVGNVTGAIFALKNMGWRDVSEIEQKVIHGKMSKADRKARIDELFKKNQNKD